MDFFLEIYFAEKFWSGIWSKVVSSNIEPNVVETFGFIIVYCDICVIHKVPLSKMLINLSAVSVK